MTDRALAKVRADKQREADDGFNERPARSTARPSSYAACFTDLDGHVWEIAHNPGFPLDDDVAVTIPDFGADD